MAHRRVDGLALTAWPFEAIGVAFSVVGLLFIAYGSLRQKQVEAALDRGE